MKKVFFIFLATFSLLACNKEENNTIDKSLTSQSFQLNNFDNLFITNDNGFLIGGVYNQKYTLIKTNDNFKIIWSKNNFDWGNVYSSSGWESSFYNIKLIKIFSGSDGNFICICSTSEHVISMTHTTLIIVLNQLGEQIQKSEFNNFETSSVIKTNDGGYVLFGTKLVKLDENFNKIWEKDISRSSYSQYEIAPTSDGGFATTGSYESAQVFLKKYNSNGDEISSYTFKHSEFLYIPV
jgi:hypothetical protein